MGKYIAILRGINVGGRRKILMADLKILFSKLGYSEIQTYIQSGNVIFNSTEKLENQKAEEIISNAIADSFGHDVPVIVRSENEWHKAISSNPFSADATVEQLHLTFLGKVPSDEKIEQLNSFEIGDDKFEILNNNAFICIQGGYRETKLTNAFFEKKLKVKATTRNWKTVLKISDLLSDN